METHGAAGNREDRRATSRVTAAHGGGLAHGEPPSEDPDARASALRLPAPEEALPALHARVRRRARAAARSRTSSSSARRSSQNSGRERTSAFVYSVGWTQHTVGVQYIRGAAIIQQLLGNMGRPGGGIVALRGHASIQGSTDIPTLYDTLPGYLPMPHDGGLRRASTSSCRRTSSPSGWWGHFKAYWVSLMKAYFGEHATDGQRLAASSSCRASTTTTPSTGRSSRCSRAR